MTIENFTVRVVDTETVVSAANRPAEAFLDLDGNSLVAVRIRDKFNVTVSGVAVLEYPTVRTLAQLVDRRIAERDSGSDR